MSKKINNYLVYAVTLGGEILYVGSGIKGREKHTTSGTSHVYELNKLHFEGADLIIKILAQDLTKEESLKKEKETILLKRPSLNKVFLKGKNEGINNANLSTRCVSILKNTFKDLFGEKAFNRYDASITEIIRMIGIGHLKDGVVIPGVRDSRRMLENSKTRTLYEKILAGPECESMKLWLSSVFFYEKTDVKIYLKISENYLDTV